MVVKRYRTTRAEQKLCMRLGVAMGEAACHLESLSRSLYREHRRSGPSPQDLAPQIRKEAKAVARLVRSDAPEEARKLEEAVAALDASLRKKEIPVRGAKENALKTQKALLAAAHAVGRVECYGELPGLLTTQIHVSEFRAKDEGITVAGRGR